MSVQYARNSTECGHIWKYENQHAILTHNPLHSERYVTSTEPLRESQSYFRIIGVVLGVTNQIGGGVPGSPRPPFWTNSKYPVH